MKKLYFLLLILLIASFADAQDLVGKITEQDSVHTPLFMAEVVQMQGGKTIATYKTYFDGTYRIKVKPSQNYDLKVTFPGRADTTVAIAVDKHATLYSGTLFISLRKDGLRLTGFVLDLVQDIPIKDASIILRNVMTRQEDRFMTDINGSYNLKMDYETNYTLKIDKMSPGIINKYQDTSFNISTIGFNKPLDFRLDIKLGPTNGYIAPRPEYDVRAKHINRNLKPALQVIGVKDTLRRKEQDSIIATLNQKLYRKDSVIASLDKRLNDINKTNNEIKVALRDIDEQEKKKDEEIARMNQEAENIKQQLADEQKKKDLEKSEADLKAKQQAEKDLQAKLDKEIRDAADKKRQQQAREAEQKEKEIYSARAQAQQDSLLKSALAKNKEMLARRKHIKDSIDLAEAKQLKARDAQAKADELAADKANDNAALVPAQPDMQDSAKINEARTRELMLKRKHVLDSLINIESQRAQIKTDIHAVDNTRINDSNRIEQAMERENHQKIKAEREQASQDSLLKIAEARNKEVLDRHKPFSDSVILAGKLKLEAKKLEKKKQEELAESRRQEELRQQEIQKQQAELAERERKANELAKLKKVREEKEKAAALKAEQEAAARKAQLEKDLAAMKKSREDAEAKVLADRQKKEQKQKELAQTAALKRDADERVAAQKGAAEQEQRDLQAKKAREEQEKKQLAEQLGSLQKINQPAINNDESKGQESPTDQALKNEKENTITAYQAMLDQQTKKRSDSMVGAGHRANASPEAKLIKARGFVKNGQTEEVISNVAINIRRLNSIVSQQVSTDESGKYDILVDSGYFYLVSFYKDKYEISKQILDLTTYEKEEYTMGTQYMKEKDDFAPSAKMPVVPFAKNSSKLPANAEESMQSIINEMKSVPGLKIKIYGLASMDEDYPMELSVTRARLFADLLLENDIKPSRIRINGIGAYRPRSGCTEGKTCTEEQYKMDRVVMYKVVKE